MEGKTVQKKVKRNYGPNQKILLALLLAIDRDRDTEDKDDGPVFFPNTVQHMCLYILAYTYILINVYTHSLSYNHLRRIES